MCIPRGPAYRFARYRMCLYIRACVYVPHTQFRAKMSFPQLVTNSQHDAMYGILSADDTDTHRVHKLLACSCKSLRNETRNFHGENVGQQHQKFMQRSAVKYIKKLRNHRGFALPAEWPDLVQALIFYTDYQAVQFRVLQLIADLAISSAELRIHRPPTLSVGRQGAPVPQLCAS